MRSPIRHILTHFTRHHEFSNAIRTLKKETIIIEMEMNLFDNLSLTFDRYC